MNTLYGIYLATKPDLGATRKKANESNPQSGDQKKKKTDTVPESDKVIPDRIIRVQSQIRCNKNSESQIPEIRLSGLWLGRLGFHAGSRIRIRAVSGKLEIKVDEDDSDEEDPQRSR